MKTHLIDIKATYLDVPTWLKREMIESKTVHTVCGYLKKNATTDKKQVTCKLCQREMNKH